MAKDIFHDQVRRALEKEGWEITDDPLRLDTLEETFNIDLGAERVLAAQRGTQQIAVEIKSFRGQSFLYEFHAAIGQYDSYLLALEEEQPERTLYLAVPAFIYKENFSSAFVQRMIQRKGLKLIVFHPVHEQVELWIN